MPFFIKFCTHHSQLLYLSSFKHLNNPNIHFDLKNLNKNFRYIYTSSCWLRKSHYDTLGVEINASTNEIKKAYFEKSKLYHPDRNVAVKEEEKKKNEKKFLNVQKAYEVLSDPDLKEEYDKKKFGRVSSNYERRVPPQDLDESQSNFYNIKKKQTIRRTRAERFELIERKPQQDIFTAKRETHEFYEKLNEQNKQHERELKLAPFYIVFGFFIFVLIILL